MPIWPAQPPESTAYPFNRTERARLAVYRAAVAAGFYNDAFTGESKHRATPHTALMISVLSGEAVASSLRR